MMTHQASYDVFLNFRGQDIGSSFTSNLYSALIRRGLVVFNDDVDLRKGEEIPASLLKAIQKSRMAIVIFSRNYASSAFCLNELVQILECHAKWKMQILPVFYDVDRTQVLHQTWTFGDAFENHKMVRFEDDKKLQNWRSALSRAAGFFGCEVKRGEETQGFIEYIVKGVIGFLARDVRPLALIQAACEKLASPQVLDFFRGRNIDESLLNSLKSNLQSIDVLGVKEKQKRFRNPLLEEWYLAILDIVFALEALLDEIDNALFECKVEAESQTNASRVLNFDMEIKSRMTQVLRNVEDHARPFRNLSLKKAGGTDIRSESEIKKPPTATQSALSYSFMPPFTELSIMKFFEGLPSKAIMEVTGRVLGREKEKGQVVDFLQDLSYNNNTNMSILGLVGPGGIGKTTLAHMVYKDDKVRILFQLRVWVTFPSYQLGAETLAKIILIMIKVSFNQDDQLPDLRSLLQKNLSGKKLLLVLDGCWSVLEWEKLRPCFESAARGSAIILTTRTAKAAVQMLVDHILHLSFLSMEHCWSLFSDHCFGNHKSSCSPQLEVVGKRILTKCGGVPLAAKMLGGLLHEKDYKVWEEIWRSQQWDKTNIDLAAPFVRLCYLYLPIELKRCINYLAMFHKGYQFQKGHVILVWIRKGLIQRENVETMEELGNKYFDFLVTSSFLINSGGDLDFTMHDMVRDLALFVSAKSQSVIDVNDESIDTSFLISNVQSVEESSSKLYDLQREAYIPSKDNVDIANITHDLDQQSPEIEVKLPTNDVVLNSFDTLRISHASQLVELPPELQSLRIEGCHTFKSLQDVLMDRSTNLFELFIIDCSFLQYFTDDSCPTSLRTLYVHKCEKLEFLLSLKKIQNFQFLEHLFIGSSCNTLKSFPMNLFPKLKILCIWDCCNLESLSIEGCQDNDLSLESLEIRDCSNLVSFPTMGLSSPNLRSLSISNCKNLRSLPNYMTNLTSLQSVFVIKCPELKSLPEGGLPSCLKLLSIAYCDKLIPQKDWNLQVLHSLQRFEIESGCMGLESFPEKDIFPVNLNSLYISKLTSLKVLDHNGLQQLTSIKSMEINCCIKLHSLPEFLPSSLTFLCIKKCPMLSQKLLNQANTDRLKIAHISNIEIDDVISE